jgi:glycogen debranching enzyme
LIGGSLRTACAEQPDTTGALAFASGVPRYDQAYRKARRVIASDVKDGNFLAGANWAQVWTRDTSYSVELACALLQPDVSRKTLLGLSEQVDGIGPCWYQDKCGHFAGWPNLTDAIVGATGAWSLYLVTGDKELLRPIYRRTANSLRRAERDAFNPHWGLFGGCSTFMESNSGYPGKYAMQGPLIAKTYALSTNILYYRGYLVAARAAELVGENGEDYKERARKLKVAINDRLWMPDQGYYAYFLDAAGKVERRMEGTGEAFAILSGVADAAKTKSILRQTPVTAWGIACLWPQYPEWTDYKKHFALYYHNGMIWPFVQGYWAWAASRSQDQGVFARELEALVKLSEKNDTFMELYRPEGGQPDGSPRQLWSASGFLSMIYHGLCGMEFEEQGIRFAPVVPQGFQKLSLSGVTYRHATLNLVVRGSGSHIQRFLLDAEPRAVPLVEASLQGTHQVEIRLGGGE